MPHKTKVDPSSKVCIFCKIAEGKVPSKRVYEDKDGVAFLDINPRSKGMTIVVPKKHFDEMHDDLLTTLKVFQTAEVVARMIKTALNPKRIEMGIMYSDEIPHFHIRLYPIYADEKPLFEGEALQMNEPELDEIADKIKAVKIRPQEAFEKKREPVKRKMSIEDERFIRRDMDAA